MGREDKATWKSNYFLKLINLLDEYPKFFIVGADNVGSKQMQQIRIGLRGTAEVLMGKNTMMRKAIRGHLDSNPALEKVLPHIVDNIGFVFTKGDLVDVRDKLLSNKKPAAAKAGALAPVDVFVPAINTGLGPEKTSFFQALQIATKITRGTIEMLNEVHIIKKDERVGASEATLLGMLNIHPFAYGLSILQVYDNGSIFHPSVLDITNEDIRSKFIEGAAIVTMTCLGIGYPTPASIPHMVSNAFRNLLAVAVETDYTFKEAEQIKEMLANPEKFASLVAAAAPVAAAAAAAEAAPAEAAPAAAAAKDESDDESGSDDDMGFGLFD